MEWSKTPFNGWGCLVCRVSPHAHLSNSKVFLFEGNFNFEDVLYGDGSLSEPRVELSAPRPSFGLTWTFVLDGMLHRYSLTVCDAALAGLDVFIIFISNYPVE